MPTELVSVRTIRSCSTSAESRNLIGVGGVRAPDETHDTTYAYWIVGTFPASLIPMTLDPALLINNSIHIISYTKPITLP